MTLSIRPEAVEAAAKAILDDDNRASGCDESWEHIGESYRDEFRSNARAAIRAFVEAEGLTEERQGEWNNKIRHDGAILQTGPDETERRLVGPWRPVVEQEEER